MDITKKGCHVMIILNILCGIGLIYLTFTDTPDAKNFLILPVLGIVLYVIRLWNLDNSSL
jgi:hypothetical protein